MTVPLVAVILNTDIIENACPFGILQALLVLSMPAPVAEANKY
jgi:hypothetical protein